MNPTAATTALWGIETEYDDASGQRRMVPPQAIEDILGILAALGLPPEDRTLPPVVVLRQGRGAHLALPKVPQHVAVDWAIVDAGTRVATGSGPARGLSLPDGLPLGSYTLEVDFRGVDGLERHATPLLIAPERAFQGTEPDRRFWALAVQLYGVRSHRNWGHGDFTDLATLIDLAAEVGAAGIGLNPLHALFDDRADQASPYSPNSRLFLNPLYIDIEAIPEFPGSEAAGLRETIAALRQSEHIDYPGVARAKIAGLRLAYQRFRAAPSAERRGDFEDFRRERGEQLAKFACFEVLRRKLPAVWWEWPEEWRTPTREGLVALRTSDENEVVFHEYVQWIADRQLAACQARAHAQGLPVGLYLDVAVGVDAGGADAWSEQSAILCHLSVGAPPDLFNPAGQNWGLAGFHPRGLAATNFAPFRQTIAAAMRYSGAIRIDHVLGLNRLFLIPHGAPAREGAYFRFPLEALLAVVAQESHDRRCITVGEDLGTVPPDLRAALADWGIWTYRVLMFERHADGLFIAPEHYPREAVATFNTHDLPTFQGWITGYDLRMRKDISHPSGESDEERARGHDALREALAHAGCNGDGTFVNVVRFLAATPSRLVVVAIEDVLGVVDQPNLPGTIDEHPNWRQRLPLALEDWRQSENLHAVAQVFELAGRRSVKASDG